MAGCFHCNCNGRLIIGGGDDDNFVSHVNTYEYNFNTFHQIPSLQFARSYSSATYVANNDLIVSGGVDNNNKNIKEIEILDINATSLSTTWHPLFPVQICPLLSIITKLFRWKINFI